MRRGARTGARGRLLVRVAVAAAWLGLPRAGAGRERFVFDWDGRAGVRAVLSLQGFAPGEAVDLALNGAALAAIRPAPGMSQVHELALPSALLRPRSENTLEVRRLAPATTAGTVDCVVVLADGSVPEKETVAGAALRVPMDGARSVRAVRLAGPGPGIDGMLDEPVWEGAGAISGFRQREPVDGVPASEATEARFLVDATALYVGISAHDSEPSAIVARLTRRDRASASDWVAVELAPRRDRRSGYRFVVTAAGVERDALLFADTHVDFGFDAQWQGAAARTLDGWTAEFRIPLDELRLGGEPWFGLNVIRHLARRDETSTWSILPAAEDGWVSRFGTLEGLEGVRTGPTLRLDPYLVAALAARSDSAVSPDLDAGLNLVFVPRPGMDARATVHPDFGQVEADAAVLNLSTFETFFPEKRPFFVAGASLFETPFRLFFTRRVGSRPARVPLAVGESVVDSATATTILEAARLEVSDERGSLGLVQALTEPARTRVRLPAGGIESRAAAPRAHYLAGRWQRILEGGSTLGSLVTAVHREGAEPAWSGGIDWDLRGRDRPFAFTGQVAASRAGRGDGRASGTALKASLAKVSGALTGALDVTAITPGFDIHDLGFLRRSDLRRGALGLSLRTFQTHGPLRGARVDVSAWHESTFAGLPLARGASVTADLGLGDLHHLGVGAERDLWALDDVDTRGGPAIAVPGGFSVWGYFTSNATRMLSLGIDASYGADDEGGARRTVGVGLTLHPVDPLEIEIRGSHELARDPAQWLESRDEGGDGLPDRFFYAPLRRQVLDLTLRAGLALSPRIALEIYMQPFLAAGDYGAPLELARPRSFTFRPAEREGNPDFSSRSLRSNAVLRFEHGSGLTTHLVWTLDRYEQDETGRIQPGRDFARLLTAPSNQVFLVKLSRRFSP